MPNNQTLTIELAVDDAQEVASTLRSTIRKIDWIIENKPPTRARELEKLDERAKQLTNASSY